MAAAGSGMAAALVPECPIVHVNGVALPECMGNVAEALVPAKSGIPWHCPAGGMDVGLHVNNSMTSTREFICYILLPLQSGDAVVYMSIYINYSDDLYNIF